MFSANSNNLGRHIWLEQTPEAADCCSTLGILLALQNDLPLFSQAQSEALGRGVTRMSWFLTQDMLLDAASTAEIVRELIREWQPQ